MVIDLVLCVCVFGCVRLVWGGWGCSGSGEQASWSQATNPTRTPAPPLRGDTWPVASHLPRIAGRVLLASRAAWHPDGRQLGSLSIFSHEAGEIKSPHLSSASSLFVFSDNTEQTYSAWLSSVTLATWEQWKKPHKKTMVYKKIKSIYLMFHITITVTTKPNIPSALSHCGQLIVTTNHIENVTDGRVCLHPSW